MVGLSDTFRPEYTVAIAVSAGGSTNDLSGI